VQSASGIDVVDSCFIQPSCKASANFTSKVTSGNLIVVGIVDDLCQDIRCISSSMGSIAVSDTLGSSYGAPYVTLTDPNSADTVQIYVATLSSSGRDNVTVVDNTGDSADLAIFAFEVSGVTTASAETATGTCEYNCPAGADLSSSIYTNSTVSFVPGAFLLSVVAADDSGASAGNGYTCYPMNCGSGTEFTEYATTGVSSPTNFPATLSTAENVEAQVGIALQPIFVTTATLTSTVTRTGSSTRSNIPTQAQVTCSPNPDNAGSQTTCTAKISSTHGTPEGKVKFYSSKGGTLSSVSCTSSAKELVCTVKYTPPASLAGESTTIKANYFARPHSMFSDSHGKTSLKVKDTKTTA
jgi:hypothetical protein